MPVIKVQKKDAESTKRQLILHKVLDHSHKPTSEGSFVYFSVKTVPRGMKPVQKKLKKTERTANFRDNAKQILSKAELNLLPRAYDTAGNVAIIDLPDKLMQHKKEIGYALIKSNKRISTVLRRGVHDGEFRTQKLEFLAGVDTRETIFSENNVKIKVNLENVYFSVRLSHDRKRICSLVKAGERVLVMFSGAGPYVCVIAKNTQAKEVVGVEINPEGHKYAEENARLNKLKNVRLICGDAKKKVPELGEFDRILMPLPHSSEEFLNVAIKAAKNGATIHFYRFLQEKEKDTAEKMCKTACLVNNKKFKKIRLVKCGQSAPGTFRYCLDFTVSDV